jgi:hypothetical protein
MWRAVIVRSRSPDIGLAVDTGNLHFFDPSTTLAIGCGERC